VQTIEERSGAGAGKRRLLCRVDPELRVRGNLTQPILSCPSLRPLASVLPVAAAQRAWWSGRPGPPPRAPPARRTGDSRDRSGDLPRPGRSRPGAPVRSQTPAAGATRESCDNREQRDELGWPSNEALPIRGPDLVPWGPLQEAGCTPRGQDGCSVDCTPGVALSSPPCRTTADQTSEPGGRGTDAEKARVELQPPCEPPASRLADPRDPASALLYLAAAALRIRRSALCMEVCQ
jgi:hypothetical protein